MRQATAKASQTARDLSLRTAALLLPPVGPGLADHCLLIETAALGARLGMYSFLELKTKETDKKKPLASLTLIPAQTEKRANVRTALNTAKITAEAIFFARDLVNRPGNLLYPEILAREAKKMAQAFGLNIQVLDMASAKKKGLGAFLGVAQGSARPGRVIIIEYQGADPGTKPVALVGKAITFDSGGLSLKPAENMGQMKTDMAGGAVVLGVLSAAAQLKLPVNLVGIVPAAENLPDGGAYRPGDILASMSGQTIEINSTDAEGRLILADGLSLALEYKPQTMIDIATLTGACVVALGEKCAGLMGNDQNLIDHLIQSGQATGERVWQLPLFDDYFEGLKSEVADFKNSGSRSAGTITAALFLKQFVSQTSWAHLDIAGPARTDQATPDTPTGATGFGVHLLLNYLRRR